jgi:hypothetical protein
LVKEDPERDFPSDERRSSERDNEQRTSERTRKPAHGRSGAAGIVNS